jgi:hypothetical protein
MWLWISNLIFVYVFAVIKWSLIPRHQQSPWEMKSLFDAGAVKEEESRSALGGNRFASQQPVDVTDRTMARNRVIDGYMAASFRSSTPPTPSRFCIPEWFGLIFHLPPRSRSQSVWPFGHYKRQFMFFKRSPSAVNVLLDCRTRDVIHSFISASKNCLLFSLNCFSPWPMFWRWLHESRLIFPSNACV